MPGTPQAGEGVSPPGIGIGRATDERLDLPPPKDHRSVLRDSKIADLSSSEKELLAKVRKGGTRYNSEMSIFPPKLMRNLGKGILGLHGSRSNRL